MSSSAEQPAQQCRDFAVSDTENATLRLGAAVPPTGEESVRSCGKQAARSARRIQTRCFGGHAKYAWGLKRCVFFDRDACTPAADRQIETSSHQAMLCMLKCPLSATHTGFRGVRASHQYWQRICPSLKLFEVNSRSDARQRGLKGRAQPQAAGGSMPGTAAEVCSAADVDCSLFNAHLRLIHGSARITTIRLTLKKANGTCRASKRAERDGSEKCAKCGLVRACL